MSVDSIHDESTGLKECAITILLGEQLGSGATRRVYALKHDPSLVVKLEYASRQFCNVAEYDLWNTVKDTPLARFFAPVIDIDVWGGSLIMKRTKPITEKIFRERLTEMPSFMDDIHWANFGLLKGQIVCHDYGYHAAIENAVKRACIRKVKHP